MKLSFAFSVAGPFRALPHFAFLVVSFFHSYLSRFSPSLRFHASVSLCLCFRPQRRLVSFSLLTCLLHLNSTAAVLPSGSSVSLFLCLTVSPCLPHHPAPWRPQRLHGKNPLCALKHLLPATRGERVACACRPTFWVDLVPSPNPCAVLSTSSSVLRLPKEHISDLAGPSTAVGAAMPMSSTPMARNGAATATPAARTATPVTPASSRRIATPASSTRRSALPTPRRGTLGVPTFSFDTLLKPVASVCRAGGL